LPCFLPASSILAVVAGKRVIHKAGDTDSSTRTLEFPEATLN
jgi:hypothetical protein